MLVLIVGCFGLASNILGLLLFHDHGHSHGGHGHSHGHDEISTAEEGHAHSHEENIMDETGNISDVLPEMIVPALPVSTGKLDTKSQSVNSRRRFSLGFTRSDEDASTTAPSPKAHRNSMSNSSHHKRHGSHSRSRQSFEDIPGHPVSFRNEIIAASRLEDIESGTSTEGTDDEACPIEEEGNATESSPLLGNQKKSSASDANGYSSLRRRTSEPGHSTHRHRQPKDDKKKSGHSHDLNMRGVFLHVMGDALGNIGVISSALIIWLTDYSWRFYSDPAISLFITIIILLSAIPLCKAASRILLQAVPAGLSIDDIKQDIEALPGVVSCHHLHVWQLSDIKLIASLHIQVSFDFKGSGSAQYMRLAKAVRTCLHEYGIHSSTIQPEFCLEPGHLHDAGSADADVQPGHSHPHSPVQAGSVANGSKVASRAASTRSSPDQCLLDCDDACGESNACCAPSARASNRDSHSH